ncbi:hypothetical protein, partial [Erwinia amylovora]|uniref:hypothetical protein n=1 Tax=Erwinia amylovora TaxID=552 RepID=UPI0020BED012
MTHNQRDNPWFLFCQFPQLLTINLGIGAAFFFGMGGHLCRFVFLFQIKLARLFFQLQTLDGGVLVADPDWLYQPAP